MSALADRAARAARHGLDEALKEIAERILAESDRNVPVGDPAADPDPAFSLAEKGSISYQRAGGGVVATIRYPGPYAAWQHENQHADHPRGGKAKFLEDALKAQIPHMQRVVAGEVRARVKAGR